MSQAAKEIVLEAVANEEVKAALLNESSFSDKVNELLADSGEELTAEEAQEVVEILANEDEVEGTEEVEEDDSRGPGISG